MESRSKTYLLFTEYIFLQVGPLSSIQKFQYTSGIYPRLALWKPNELYSVNFATQYQVKSMLVTLWNKALVWANKASASSSHAFILYSCSSKMGFYHWSSVLGWDHPKHWLTCCPSSLFLSLQIAPVICFSITKFPLSSRIITYNHCQGILVTNHLPYFYFVHIPTISKYDDEFARVAILKFGKCNVSEITSYPGLGLKVPVFLKAHSGSKHLELAGFLKTIEPSYSFINQSIDVWQVKWITQDGIVCTGRAEIRIPVSWLLEFFSWLLLLHNFDRLRTARCHANLQLKSRKEMQRNNI